jgi:hypothetical protein
MIRYKTFITLFIICIFALIVFLSFYIKAILGLVAVADNLREDKPSAMYVINLLFSPQVVISAIVLGLSSLAYRILGIVGVARNKIVSDGEKALWIIGFVIMGFITGIIFLALAKKKEFAE